MPAWLRGYNRRLAAADGLAALIVSLLLVPQSLAYAMLAGLPAVHGLYASILPLLAYALFGSSPSLAVGPVAVLSLIAIIFSAASCTVTVVPEGTSCSSPEGRLLTSSVTVRVNVLDAVSQLQAPPRSVVSWTV